VQVELRDGTQDEIESEWPHTFPLKLLMSPQGLSYNWFPSQWYQSSDTMSPSKRLAPDGSDNGEPDEPSSPTIPPSSYQSSTSIVTAIQPPRKKARHQNEREMFVEKYDMLNNDAATVLGTFSISSCLCVYLTVYLSQANETMEVRHLLTFWFTPYHPDCDQWQYKLQIPMQIVSLLCHLDTLTHTLSFQ